MKSLSCVQLLTTPWTAAYQAYPPMGFSSPWDSPGKSTGMGCHCLLHNWAIILNKASGGDGIPVELFQILKDDAVKVLHSICQQIWKTQQWPQDWKRSVFIPIPKKCNAKECSNCCTVSLISHAIKVVLKILQGRPQPYVNHQLSRVQDGFRKGRGTKDQTANINCIFEKSREFQKNQHLL